MPLCDSQVTSTGNAQQFTGLIILLLDELDELIVTIEVDASQSFMTETCFVS